MTDWKYIKQINEGRAARHECGATERQVEREKEKNRKLRKQIKELKARIKEMGPDEE